MRSIVVAISLGTAIPHAHRFASDAGARDTRAWLYFPSVYTVHMTRTNTDIDDEACTEVMRRYRLSTKREAVNFALRTVAAEPLGLDEARGLRGSGWDGDLDEMRSGRAR